MAGEDFIHGRAQPHDAAAQIELGHLERHDGVVGRGGRGARDGMAICGSVMSCYRLYVAFKLESGEL